MKRRHAASCLEMCRILVLKLDRTTDTDTSSASSIVLLVVVGVAVLGVIKFSMY